MGGSEGRILEEMKVSIKGVIVGIIMFSERSSSRI